MRVIFSFLRREKGNMDTIVNSTFKFQHRQAREGGRRRTNLTNILWNCGGGGRGNDHVSISLIIRMVKDF